MKKTRLSQSAFVLPSIIITTVFLSAIAVVVTDLAVRNLRVAAEDRYRLNAQLAADAGLDDGIVQLNLDNDWTGTSGEVELLNDGDVRSTYETTVVDISSSAKQLEVTGRTYKPVTSSTPRNERSFIVDLNGIGPLDLGDFAIITGAGGLIMENSSKIVAGEVFVNGEIIMDNTAQIGTASAPTSVRSAHQLCPNPPDATYPQVCTPADGEPIDMRSSSHIYAEVQATNQVDGSQMSDPGLVAGSPAPEPLPAHDRDAQKLAATNIMTAAAASCNSNTGTRTIPANTHITGGDVEWKKKCDINVLGDVWIDGNLTMENTAEILVSDSVGTTMPTIMVDGSTGIRLRNSTRVTSNNQDIGVRMISYHSLAACSPDCADVTGVDLANSRSIPTIELEQSFTGPESILYARWTQLHIVNSGDIGAIVGQTIRMRNSTTITFGTSVAGGGGPTTVKTWILDGYRRDF